MKKTSVSQAKSKLSMYLKDVQRGETVLIFDRNRPVARLEPVSGADIPETDRIRDLVRSGIVIAPRRALDVDVFLALPRPTLPLGISASEAVVQERDESL